MEEYITTERETMKGPHLQTSEGPMSSVARLRIHLVIL